MFNGTVNIRGSSPVFNQADISTVVYQSSGSQGFKLLAKHVATGALHNSGEVFDAPKCDAGTRVAILDTVFQWAMASVYLFCIQWIYGPAGAGKSAILRTLAEMLEKRGQLLASFFFRAAAGRNNTDHFIPTIAYQIALSIPSTRCHIEQAVETDPLIFSRSLEAQAQALIILPIIQAHRDGGIEKEYPRIIVVDGLDECQGEQKQCTLLRVLSNLLLKLPIPFAIIVASRPEPHICDIFNSDLNQTSARLELKCTYEPGHDIQQPRNVVAFTNNPPSVNPMKVIRTGFRKLVQRFHPPNVVPIQFAQLGNDTRAEIKVTDDPSVNMVDTVDSGTKFDLRPVFGAAHPIHAKVASSSGLQCLYYRIYSTESALVTKRPAYLDDSYLGRIRLKWVTPPYNAGSLRLYLSSMENIDPSKTKLFATPTSNSPLADNVPISFNIGDALGKSPEEPLALFSEVTPMDGLKPGTESLYVPPDSNCPITPQLLYYGIYSQGGVLASKAPINKEEVWISQLDLNLVPPLASLVRLISQKEGIRSSSQLFVGKDFMAPLSIDHILTDRNKRPGSTVEDHVTFKLDPGCAGFPTGRFQIRAAGTTHLWTCHNGEKDGEGNSLCIWTPWIIGVQTFYVNSAGNLCCDGGMELDIVGNAVTLTRYRQCTEPWPNPWSHPLPTFSYAKESKTITVKFHCDPLVSDRWPRPEKEWKEKEFVLAARSVVATRNQTFQEIARWGPENAQSTRQWVSNAGHGSPAYAWYNLGVEEKGIDLDRMEWELKPI